MRALRFTIIYIINIPIYILPTDQSVQSRRQVYGACSWLYVCGVRGKKLNRDSPNHSYPSSPAVDHTTLHRPTPSPVARNYVHPIEFLYRGKRTKRELCAYNICIYKVSPRGQTVERDVVEGSGSCIVHGVWEFQKRAVWPADIFYPRHLLLLSVKSCSPRLYSGIMPYLHYLHTSRRYTNCITVLSLSWFYYTCRYYYFDSSWYHYL